LKPSAALIVESNHTILAAARPFVILHGLGDACSNSGMKQITQLIATGANTYGNCIEFGAGGDSFTTTIQAQIEKTCAAIQADAKLANGFNIVGLSQGNAVARGVIEQCDTARVYNFVSLGGPHEGTSSLPQCPSGPICALVDSFLRLGVYSGVAQNHIAPANYFKDPSEIDTYLKSCTWLPYINNEQPTALNATYKAKLADVNELTLVKFLADTVLSPPDTEWFGFWSDASRKAITPMNQTAGYASDAIGLKTLNEKGAIKFVAQPGQHLNIDKALLDNTVIPAMRNSF